MRPGRELRIAIAITALCAAGAASAELTFEPTLDLALNWVDNIELAPPDDPAIEDWVLEAIPGFTLDYKGTRATAQAEYTLTALFSEDDSDRNQVYHTGDALLTADIVERWLFVDVVGSYSQQTIAPERPVNSSLLFDTNNVTDVAAYRVSPYVDHDFRHAHFKAQYTAARVDYLDDDPLNEVVLGDSEHRDTLFVLESPEDEAGRLAWRVQYDSQHAMYDEADDFRYEEATAELGWRLTPTFKILGRSGLESDLDESLSDGGLDNTWWEAGFDWQASRTNRLYFVGGERFYGRTFNGLLEHQARVFRVSMQYLERPTTVAEELALRPYPTQPEMGTTPLEDLNRLTSEVYLRREWDLRMSLTGQRTEISLVALNHRRTYLETGLEERERGGGVEVNRRMSALFTLYGEYTLQRVELRDGGDFKDQRMMLGISKKIGSSVTTALELSHIERDSDVDPYDVNWATLRFTKTF